MDKGIKVLVVDDNQDNLTVVRAVLADTFPGSTVETALNGLSGLAKARTLDPDVILLDIVMPEMDGFEVCRRLKQDEDLRNIPVVFLTALRSEREIRIKALEAGGEAFLSKPIDETELTAQIRAMTKIKASNHRERREKERLVTLVAERTRELENELTERRRVEQELRLANQKLEVGHASTLNFIADLKAEMDARKRSEQALRDSELLYHSLVENISQCILRKDRAGRFVFCNQKFCRLIGCALEQLLGKTDADFFPPELARKYREDDQRVMDEGRSLEIVEENLTQQGSRWMEVIKSPVRDAAGRVVGVQAIFWDISARRKLEAEREKALADFQMLFNKMIDGFALHEIICDAADKPMDYRFLAVNPAFEKLTGLRSETVVGHTVREVLPGIDPFWIKTYGAVALSGEPTSFEHFEQQMGRHFQVTAFCPERGQFACAFVDISERKRSEQALRESLQEKESLLKEVHHRVKNNLQIVVSLLSLQSNRMQKPEMVEALRETQSRVRAMALLHETLYRSADLAHIEFQTYLDTLCKHLFRTYGPEASRITLQLRAVGVELCLDQAVPCGLIISELVSNTLKHAFPEGRTGAITVELRPESNQSLRLSVADTGVGLPPDADPQRTQSLGLQLVFNLARQLHGTVEFAPGPGARVTVTFPLRPSLPTS